MRSIVLILRKSNIIQRTLLVILYTVLCKMAFLVLLVRPLKMPWRISYSIKYTTLLLHIYDFHGALMHDSCFGYWHCTLVKSTVEILADPCCLHLHRHGHPVTLPVLITRVYVLVGTDPLDSSSDNVRQKWVIENSSIRFIK